MLKAPHVSVVIPTYGGTSEVIPCLQSVETLDYSNFDVIVVDQNSSQETYLAMKRLFPSITVLRTGKNLGRTGGYNFANDLCKGEYVLHLDHDTIVDPSLLKSLVDVAESDYQIGAVGAKIYYHDSQNKIWSTGTFVDLRTGRTYFVGQGQSDRGQFENVRGVQQHPTALLIRRSVLSMIGGYDERLFMCYCDSDLCLRIGKAGYKILYAPKAKLWHRVYKSPVRSPLDITGMPDPARAYLVGRNRIVFIRKHSSLVNFLRFTFSFLPLYCMFYTAVSTAHHRVDCTAAFWRGVSDGIGASISKINQYPVSKSLLPG